MDEEIGSLVPNGDGDKNPPKKDRKNRTFGAKKKETRKTKDVEAGIERGAGGGVKHQKHGKGSEHSSAGMRRKARKRDKDAATIRREKKAMRAAMEELEEMKKKLQGKDLKNALRGKTEDEWLRNRMLEILGRR